MSTAVAVQNSSPLGSRESDRRSLHSSSHSPRNSNRRPSVELSRNMASSSATSAAKPTAQGAESRPSKEDDRPKSQAQASSQPSESNRGAPEESSSAGGAVPLIKKEQPASPPPHPSSSNKHRPRKLDLSNNSASNSRGPASAALTSKESLTTMQDIGIACLSPGFQTSNPDMQQNVALSIEMQKRQRQIIEARKKVEGQGDRMHSTAASFSKGPGTSKRRGPPPGLSITAHPPSHFSNEPRVVQSAPLNQSFTGLRGTHGHPLSRQVLDRSQAQVNAGPSQQSPSQASNRLPPISDVLGSDGFSSGSPRNGGSLLPPPGRAHSPSRNGPLPSPGLPQPPHSAGLHPPAGTSNNQSQGPSPPNQRHREYKSAEDAVRGLSGGREELIPRLVHYGGHQPPTPPSPLAGNSRDATQQGGSSTHASRVDRNTTRRRNREEYERDYTGAELDEHRREFHDERARRILGPLPVRHDSPDTQRRKKDEFLHLMSRAWDLMHS